MGLMGLPPTTREQFYTKTLQVNFTIIRANQSPTVPQVVLGLQNMCFLKIMDLVVGTMLPWMVQDEVELKVDRTFLLLGEV